MNAQTGTGFWTSVIWSDITLAETAEIDFEPKAYQAYEADYDALRHQLAQAPMEFTGAAKNAPVILNLPLANGTFERFALVESPVMAPELQARFPEIRTYSGYSLDNPQKKIHCSLSPGWGFRAMVVRPDKGIEYIEPLARWQTRYYRVYDRLDFPNEMRIDAKTEIVFSPDYDPTVRVALPDPRPTERGAGSPDPVVLKKYRFAAACTGEFSQDNGGTTPLVLAKVVDVVKKLNAIYERDLAIRLELVANNDKIIFLDPATDPYTGTTVGGWLDQNPLAMVQNLGSADQYDLGHVFARYLGGGAVGVGHLNSGCTSFKGRGCSAGNVPYGDYFFSVIGQEIGHQWNSGHTWTHCGQSPGDFPGSACEPGSGTTIMSYSGACGPDNVSSGLGDLYYNVCSILEIRSFVENGFGANCGVNIVTDNTEPVAIIPYSNGFFIPISTPFELSGVGQDVDGDPLTYCWEEIDTGPLVPLGSPVGNTPIFRSYPPTASPTRTFPRMQTIVSNQSSIAEILPTYTRDLNFALTVRDDREGGGGIGIDTLRFKATDLAGPFLVSYPSGASATWIPGEYQEVTWDVANTDKAPVNCKKVNIKLSTSGGLSYPITLATNVANTGRYCVQVPNFPTNSARVRVEAADNVFFDISNANFRIQAPTQPGFTFCPMRVFDTVCLPASFSTVISTAAQLSFSEPIAFSAANLPAGVTATFTPNPVMPGAETVMTLDLPANQTETTFEITLHAQAGALSQERLQTFSVFFNDFTNLALELPADGAVGQDRGPLFRWNGVADANTYEIQVAINPSFAAGTLVSTSDNVVPDSFRFANLLEKGTVYYWRVRPKNECGSGAWAGPYVFSTLVDVCALYESIDLPKNITGSQAITVESKINVPFGGQVSDVNISRIQGFHEYFKDLEMHLISPSGKDVLLFKDKCPNYNGNFSFGFDDSKPGIFGCPPPKDGASYKPVENLSKFNGDNINGDWILRVKDNLISSGGAIQVFNLELCSNTTSNPPVLVNNNPLQVAPGANAGISVSLLKTEDANNSDAELLYTLMTIPAHGQLQLNGSGVAMQVGDQFTQLDLNNNGLRYFDYGSSTGPDAFCFTVTDGEGGLIKACFTVQPFPVSTQETTRALNFLLAPNPATEIVRIAFGEALRSDTRIRVFDAAGRLVHNAVLAGGQVFAQLDVARLPEGLYTVAVDNREGSGVRKLVVR